MDVVIAVRWACWVGDDLGAWEMHAAEMHAAESTKGVGRKRSVWVESGKGEGQGY